MYVGFDCGHVNDFVPNIENEWPDFMQDIMKEIGYQEPTEKDYKNVEYAIEYKMNLF